MTGTPLSCHRSITIVADGRLEVCDGAHWAFVMKKSQRIRPSEAWTATRPQVHNSGSNFAASSIWRPRGATATCLFGPSPKRAKRFKSRRVRAATRCAGLI